MRSERERRETRWPELSTIGSLPFLDVERTWLASRRVVPDGAVVSSVDMTDVTGSSREEWNWISRVVIMPMSLLRRVPFSASLESAFLLHALGYVGDSHGFVVRQGVYLCFHMMC